MQYTVAHWNGSDDGWVESGPYLHGWFDSKEEAETYMNNLKEYRQSNDGWNLRWKVFSEEEYRNL
jgi:hypothetical protein